MTDKSTPKAEVSPEFALEILERLNSTDRDQVARWFLLNAPAVSSEPEVDLDEYSRVDIRTAIATPGSVRGLEPERISAERLQDYLDGKLVATTDSGTKPQPKVRPERDGSGAIGRWLKAHIVGVGQFICVALGVIIGWIMFTVFSEALISLILGNKYVHPQAAWWTGKGLWFVLTFVGGWSGNLFFRFLYRRSTHYDNSERNAR